MTKPNVLFFMTDHTNAQALRPDSPCKTPNLDALAADGVRFHRCYTTNAICSPARASLMTGLYASTHGMWDCTHTQRREWVDVPADRFTYFSHVLADNGYHNGYFGKWHVEQSCKLEDFGWHDYDGSIGNSPKPPVAEERVTVQTAGYRDALLAGVTEETTRHPAVEKGLEYMKTHHLRDPDSPFCCFISCSEPHDPYIPPREFLDLYDLDTIELSPSLTDPATDKPEIIRRMQHTWKGLSPTDWRRMTASYYAVISYLDHEFGRVVDYLKANGLYDDTIIVFLSDHGDMLGAHGLCTKGVGTAYEEVYNIPLIVKPVNGVSGVEDSRTVVGMVDVAPTLLEACGIGPLADAQGESFLPILNGATADKERSSAYAEFYGQRFVYTQRIVWYENWKYVFSPGGVDELYDLAVDPNELRNLASDPNNHERLIDMCTRMWKKAKDIGDDSLVNSNYETLRTAPIGPLVAKLHGQ